MIDDISRSGQWGDLCADRLFSVFYQIGTRFLFQRAVSAAGSLLEGFLGWLHDVLCASEVVGDGG